MIEYCPHCKAKNARVHAEIVVQGWMVPDDYCGRCGKNWPRPTDRPGAEKVAPFPQPADR